MAIRIEQEHGTYETKKPITKEEQAEEQMQVLVVSIKERIEKLESWQKAVRKVTKHAR